MTNYVESTLVEGEKIMCHAHYHWFWWLKRILFYLAILVVGIGLDRVAKLGSILSAIVVVIALIGLGYAFLRYTTDEIVITSHRVVLKTKILARDVFEMQIQKVETIQVDQTVAGRFFNYGTVCCRGTGGTRSSSVEIADPLAFRAAFQNAIRCSMSPIAPVYTSAAPAQTPAPAATTTAAPALDNAKLDEVISLLKEISAKLDQKA